MALPAAIGITKVSDSQCESVEITQKGEVKTLITKDGSYSDAAVIDPTFEFTVRGKGGTNPPAAIAGSTGAPSGLSGKIIITSVKRSQVGDDFGNWEYGGTAFPSAT